METTHGLVGAYMIVVRPIVVADGMAYAVGRRCMVVTVGDHTMFHQLHVLFDGEAEPRWVDPACLRVSPEHLDDE